MSLVGKKLTQLNFAKHQKQRAPLKKKHSKVCNNLFFIYIRDTVSIIYL